MTQLPYAVKAVIQHEFDTDHLNIFVTFRFAMNQTVKPPDNLWLCEVDDVPKAITVSAWQDAWTLLLTVPDVVVLPERVTLEYDGPHPDLKITWDKQWEYWGPIVSIELPPVNTTRTFSTGPAVQPNVDVSNVNVLFIDCSANAITISGLVGGVNGQRLYIARLCIAGNAITLQYDVATGNQRLLLHAGADETLTGEYGGWILVCNGTNWYDCSHAKHV